MATPLEQLQVKFIGLKFGMFIPYNMATYTGQQWVEGYPDPATFNPRASIETLTEIGNMWKPINEILSKHK